MQSDTNECSDKPLYMGFKQGSQHKCANFLWVKLSETFRASAVVIERIQLLLGCIWNAIHLLPLCHNGDAAPLNPQSSIKVLQLLALHREKKQPLKLD